MQIDHLARMSFVKGLIDQLIDAITSAISARQMLIAIILTAASALLFYFSPSTAALNITEYIVVLAIWMILVALTPLFWRGVSHWMQKIWRSR